MLNFDLPGFLDVLRGEARGGGDILLSVGSPPRVVVEDRLVRVALPGLEQLTPFQTETVVVHLLGKAPPSVAVRIREDGAAHFAYSVPGTGRFRAAVFCQRGSYAVALRSIPESLPTLETSGLPDTVRQACREHSGIVLVNGPAGAGRTTTLAAMIAEINRTRACHIVTVEDPIEFLHRHECAVVNQRQVGLDTPSLVKGLGDGLRQGAQVLMASEVHTDEEAHLLLEAAETGHLVLSTVRGLNTASALSRFLSLFPIEDRAEARVRLARALRWCFSQRLVQHHDRRRPVLEVWRATDASAAHLESGSLDPASFADVLHDGEADGMVEFDRDLERRVNGGELDRRQALAVAIQPRRLDDRLAAAGEGKP